MHLDPQIVRSLPPLPDHDVDWKIGEAYQFQDIGIVIEYLAGDTRTKFRDSGIQVSNVMPAAYGFIMGTTDIHGEEIDMYLASNPHRNGLVYVIDQIEPATGMFDEHKVMLGFDDIDEVIATYNLVFSDGSGPARLGAITTFTQESFNSWLDHEGYAHQPASRCTSVETGVVILRGFSAPRPNPKSFPLPIDSTGGVIIDLPDMSKGPSIKVSPNIHGGMQYTVNLFRGLDTTYWTNLIDQLVRTLDFATEKDIFTINLNSPGGSVYLMGRVVSAIHTTKAHVITRAVGQVASAATAIWAAGKERHIQLGAFFMQHMSSQNLGGKTSDIAAKSLFCRQYIGKQLTHLVDIGLFTQKEIDDMVVRSADVFISGREAISRVGEVSYDSIPETDHA